MFGKLASTLFNAARQIGPIFCEKQFHTASQSWITNSLCSSGVNPTPGGSWALISVRNNIRNHFPYPKEHKRIKKHGWLHRMSTPAGRRVLMRRILKGKHVLSH